MCQNQFGRSQECTRTEYTSIPASNVLRNFWTRRIEETEKRPVYITRNDVIQCARNNVVPQEARQMSHSICAAQF